jgi:hypothetical protein
LYIGKGDSLDFRDNSKGILEVWRFPYHQLDRWDGLHWNRRYCIGSDVSEGLGQSYSVAYVYDRRRQEMVARLRTNKVDAHQWADLLLTLSDYYNSASQENWQDGRDMSSSQKALVCVETTGAGQTTVKHMKDMGGNLYLQTIPDKATSEVVMRYGWHESNQAKYTLSEDLRAWFRTTPGTVFCQILVDECSTWIKHEGGKIGPEDDNKFGDCVIAAGLAIQADMFLESPPTKHKPPLTGWRAKQQEGRSAWAR